MPAFDRIPRLPPPDPWCLTEHGFDSATSRLHDALFAVGNGTIALRGGHEERSQERAEASPDGSYPDGYPEPAAIIHHDASAGPAHERQRVLALQNPIGIALNVGGERFDLDSANITHYLRSLDFRTGLLERSLVWSTASGKQLASRSRRVACFAHKHLFAIEYQVTPLNFSGPLWLLSTLDGAAGEQEGSFSAISQCNSGLTLVSAIDSVLPGAGQATFQDGDTIGQAFTVNAIHSRPLRLTKFGACFASRTGGADELMAHARQALDDAHEAGFEALCAQQQAWLADFWSTASIATSGDAARQQEIHLRQFHLLQATLPLQAQCAPPAGQRRMPA